MGNALIVLGVILVVIACLGFLIGCFGGGGDGACVLVVVVIVFGVFGAWLISTGNNMQDDEEAHHKGSLPTPSYVAPHKAHQ